MSTRPFTTGFCGIGRHLACRVVIPQSSSNLRGPIECACTCHTGAFLPLAEVLAEIDALTLEPAAWATT